MVLFSFACDLEALHRRTELYVNRVALTNSVATIGVIKATAADSTSFIQQLPLLPSSVTPYKITPSVVKLSMMDVSTITRGMPQPIKEYTMKMFVLNLILSFVPQCSVLAISKHALLIQMNCATNNKIAYKNCSSYIYDNCPRKCA